MKKEDISLSAEPLSAQKEWQWNGITVLRAQLSLPQLSGTSRRVRRFNSYYEKIGRVFLARAGTSLFPRAAEECRAAMVRSAPWQMTEVFLHGDITLQQDDLLSVVLNFSIENGTFSFRCADTWDLSQMLPITLSEWFPPHVCLHRRAAEKLRQDASSGAPRRFRPCGYYLTEADFFLLGRDGRALSLPFDSVRGPFPPKKQAERTPS